jgi:cell division protease FtsH
MDDRHTWSREYIYNRIAIMFGGRVAEELSSGQITTGAGDDIEKATDLARRMVCEWGMSENLGPMTFGKKEEQIFLGRDFTQTKDYSEQTAIEIDSEVRRILKDAYERAKRLLRANLETLHKMATVLLEKEVLDGNEIDELLRTFGSSNGVAGEAQPAAS